MWTDCTSLSGVEMDLGDWTQASLLSLRLSWPFLQLP